VLDTIDEDQTAEERNGQTTDTITPRDHIVSDTQDENNARSSLIPDDDI